LKTTLEVGPFLAPGSKAEVHPRLNDTAGRYGKAVKTVKVGDDGQVQLDGLEPFGPYWLFGEDEAGNSRSISFTATGKTQHDPTTALGLGEEQEARSAAVQKMRESYGTAGAAADSQRTDVGADVPEHNFEKTKGEAEPEPRPKYVDVTGPQRVGADIGTAYPKDPDEAVPHPSVDTLSKGATTRVGADAGYAYTKEPDEQVPAKRYEDESGKQRVGAETGTAYPKPKTASKREQAEVKDSSVSKAKGATVAQAGTTKAKGKAKAAPVKKSATKKAR
jgi:hypothetical protein